MHVPIAVVQGDVAAPRDRPVGDDLHAFQFVGLRLHVSGEIRRVDEGGGDIRPFHLGRCAVERGGLLCQSVDLFPYSGAGLRGQGAGGALQLGVTGHDVVGGAVLFIQPARKYDFCAFCGAEIKKKLSALSCRKLLLIL